MRVPHSGEPSRWELFQAAAEGALDRRRDPQAKRLLLAALQAAEQFGARDPRLLVTLQRLIDLADGQNDTAQMEQWCRRVLLLQEASLGPQHPAVADTLDRLARATNAQGKAGEAEALYRRRLAILEQANGPESPEVVDALISCGPSAGKK